MYHTLKYPSTFSILMKKQLSALELSYLVKEWQFLIGGKMDMIYQKGKEELLLQFHITSKGKQMLKIFLPSMMYLTQYKGQQPETPPGFCMFLRKHLKNARLQRIEQKEFERILDFTFSTKDKTLHLMIELFSDGNIVLCDDKYKILSPLSTGNWKDRTIRGGVDYTYPKREINTLTLDYRWLLEALSDSEKESIVKTLAIDIGLGGIYAEEVCSIAGVNKSKKSLNEGEAKKIFYAIEEIRTKECKGFVYPEDIVPFKLKSSKMDVVKEFDSFNQALDEILTENKIQDEIKVETSKKEKETNKIWSIINEQGKRAKEIEEDIDTSTKKGELIYQHYTVLKEALDTINKAKKKYSWDEIKEKLEGHKLIKEINPKDKTITVDID